MQPRPGLAFCSDFTGGSYSIARDVLRTELLHFYKKGVSTLTGVLQTPTWSLQQLLLNSCSKVMEFQDFPKEMEMMRLYLQNEGGWAPECQKTT